LVVSAITNHSVLETRPLRGDHELYVFILLAGVSTLMNVLWCAYVVRVLRRQAQKHRNIVLVEKNPP
jgi:hypothetical protein